METRSIAIGLVAIVAAFAAAFGMAKSGGSKTETAGAGVKAESIKVAAPAAVAGVEVGGTLPALKAERKAPAKKKKPRATEAVGAVGRTTRRPRRAPATSNRRRPEQPDAEQPTAPSTPRRATTRTPPANNPAPEDARLRAAARTASSA